MFRTIGDIEVFEFYGRTYALLGARGRPRKIPTWLSKPGWLFTMNETKDVLFMWNKRRGGDAEMLALDAWETQQ